METIKLQGTSAVQDTAITSIDKFNFLCELAEAEIPSVFSEAGANYYGYYTNTDRIVNIDTSSNEDNNYEESEEENEDFEEEEENEDFEEEEESEEILEESDSIEINEEESSSIAVQAGTGLKEGESSENYIIKYFFMPSDFDYLVFYIKISVNISLGEAIYSIGTCKATDIGTDTYLPEQSLDKTLTLTENTVGNQYSITLSSITVPYVTSNGSFKTLFLTNEINSDYLLFGTDDSGDNYVICQKENSNNLYYDEESPTAYQFDTSNESISNSLSMTVLIEKAKIFNSSNSLVSITSEPTLIYADALIAEGNKNSFQLIDVEGTRYRQLRGKYWITD
jgi:hypothetical protein